MSVKVRYLADLECGTFHRHDELPFVPPLGMGIELIGFSWIVDHLFYWPNTQTLGITLECNDGREPYLVEMEAAGWIQE